MKNKNNRKINYPYGLKLFIYLLKKYCIKYIQNTDVRKKC